MWSVGNSDVVSGRGCCSVASCRACAGAIRKVVSITNERLSVGVSFVVCGCL